MTFKKLRLTLDTRGADLEHGFSKEYQAQTVPQKGDRFFAWNGAGSRFMICHINEVMHTFDIDGVQQSAVLWVTNIGFEQGPE